MARKSRCPEKLNEESFGSGDPGSGLPKCMKSESKQELVVVFSRSVMPDSAETKGLHVNSHTDLRPVLTPRARYSSVLKILPPTYIEKTFIYRETDLDSRNRITGEAK